MPLPAHIPTPENKEKVKHMAVAGIPQKKIASVLGITDMTLAKHYRAELDSGLASCIEESTGILMRNIRDGKEASLIFLLKTKGGFKEGQNNETPSAPFGFFHPDTPREPNE